MHFTRAIVRPPARSFASGLSAANQGPPDFDLALEQHGRYCDALRGCGLKVASLEADLDYPDGTFVEDAAIVTGRGAIITRPGAPSRTGEVASVGESLRHFFADLQHIAAPGTVDGGDVCQVADHFLIGVSARTNEHGAQQLAEHLGRLNYRSSILDIRASATLLHLKTGIAYLGDGAWLVAGGVQDEILGSPALAGGAVPIRDRISVSAGESYAANCVRINDTVLVAAGYPRVTAALEERGYRLAVLQMSEFRKMDGGLSCLSLRF